MKSVFTVSLRSIVYMFLILSIGLITFSCDQQTTSPISSFQTEENVQYTAAQAISGMAKTDFAKNISDQDIELPKCILLPELPDWPNADFVIEQVTIQNDIITFILSYSGGCKSHDFQLVSNAFQESNPSENVALAPKFQVFHNNNDDPCDQWITEVRQFDLSPVKELYFKMYGTRCSSIEVNLVNAIPQNSDSDSNSKLTYQFCQDIDINSILPVQSSTQPRPTLPTISIE